MAGLPLSSMCSTYNRNGVEASVGSDSNSHLVMMAPDEVSEQSTNLRTTESSRLELFKDLNPYASALVAKISAPYTKYGSRSKTKPSCTGREWTNTPGAEPDDSSDFQSSTAIQTTIQRRGVCSLQSNGRNHSASASAGPTIPILSGQLPEDLFGVRIVKPPAIRTPFASNPASPAMSSTYSHSDVNAPSTSHGIDGPCRDPGGASLAPRLPPPQYCRTSLGQQQHGQPLAGDHRLDPGLEQVTEAESSVYHEMILEIIASRKQDKYALTRPWLPPQAPASPQVVKRVSASRSFPTPPHGTPAEEAGEAARLDLEQRLIFSRPEP